MDIKGMAKAAGGQTSRSFRNLQETIVSQMSVSLSTMAEVARSVIKDLRSFLSYFRQVEREMEITFPTSYAPAMFDKEVEIAAPQNSRPSTRMQG